MQMGNGRGMLPMPEFEETRDHASFEETREEAEPAVVNVAVHPPPRQPTPQPSREQDLDEKLGEVKAEFRRLGTLLPVVPEPGAKEPEFLRGSLVPSSPATKLIDIVSAG